MKEKITQTGSKVKIHWTVDEVKGSGWKGGWYTAKVHRYNSESDCNIPSTPYEEELGELLALDKIKLVWSPL